MAKDKNYNRLIHTMRWLRLRREALRKHPMCQHCEQNGVYRSATEVHHIVPCEYAINTAAMEQLMFDANNLLCLCHDCHVKAHIELGRSGKAATKRINESKLEQIKKKFY